MLRQNQVPKYCMRLEMGRLPPDPDEVDEQRTDLQDAVREFLFESDANNRTDNITELLHAIKGITLEVEDLVSCLMIVISVILFCCCSATRNGAEDSRLGRPPGCLRLWQSEEPRIGTPLWPIAEQNRG